MFLIRIRVEEISITTKEDTFLFLLGRSKDWKSKDISITLSSPFSSSISSMNSKNGEDVWVVLHLRIWICWRRRRWYDKLWWFIESPLEVSLEETHLHMCIDALNCLELSSNGSREKTKKKNEDHVTFWRKRKRWITKEKLEGWAMNTHAFWPIRRIK